MDNQKLRQKTLDRVSVVLLLNSEYVMKTAMLIRTYFFTVCLESSESWLAVLSPQEFHLHVDKSLFFLCMS